MRTKKRTFGGFDNGIIHGRIQALLKFPELDKCSVEVFNIDFIRKCLGYIFNLDQQTPFEGVKTMSPALVPAMTAFFDDTYKILNKSHTDETFLEHIEDKSKQIDKYVKSVIPQKVFVDKLRSAYLKTLLFIAFIYFLQFKYIIHSVTSNIEVFWTQDDINRLFKICFDTLYHKYIPLLQKACPSKVNHVVNIYTLIDDLEFFILGTDKLIHTTYSQSLYEEPNIKFKKLKHFFKGFHNKNNAHATGSVLKSTIGMNYSTQTQLYREQVKSRFEQERKRTRDIMTHGDVENEEYMIMKQKYENMTMNELVQAVLDMDQANESVYAVKALMNVAISKFDLATRCEFFRYVKSIFATSNTSKENGMLLTLFEMNKSLSSCPEEKDVEFMTPDFISNLQLLFGNEKTDKIWTDTPTTFHLYYSNIDDLTIQEQIDFLKRLSMKELLTLHNYSYRGDVLVNALLRKNVDKTKEIVEQSAKISNSRSNSSDSLGGVNKKLNFRLLPQIVKYYENAKNLDKQLDELDDNFKQSREIVKTLDVEYSSLVKNEQKLTDILFSLVNKVVFKTSFYILLAKNYKQDLSRIIDKAPPFKNRLVLYRGVSHDYSKKDRNVHNGFISTTLVLLNAELFAKNRGVIYRYLANEGTRGILLCLISKFKSENEVLLSEGQVYDVKRSRKLGNYTMVDVELRPHIIPQNVVRGEQGIIRSASKSSVPTSPSTTSRKRANSITGGKKKVKS